DPDHSPARLSQAGVKAQDSEGCGVHAVPPATVRDVFLGRFAGGGKGVAPVNRPKQNPATQILQLQTAGTMRIENLNH
ncbi:hypothetical protein, partial [Phenylobacterium sp.]|uniref:hypothetical protein n=1 Tax=Phenylobacterium sp. TaxID=1871053 RepID=UPI0025F49F6A